MQAVVLDGPERLRLEDRPERAPGQGEVLIDVLASGICGTDLEIYSGSIGVKYPLVMGHEMFGRIAALGGGVDEFGLGERVAVDPMISCGACDFCLGGQGHICPRGAFLGRDRDGAFTQRVTVPVSNVHPLPDSIDDSIAPLIQVVAVCLHAHTSAPLDDADTVLVIGLGVTGLLHLQIARARGARRVIGITRSAAKRSAARILGTDLVLDAADPEVSDRVRSFTSRSGPNLVIECAGKLKTLAQAIELVRPGGHIVQFGTITETSGALPFYKLYHKELTLTHPRASTSEDFAAAIALVESGQLILSPLVTHSFSLDRAQEAIDTTRSGQALKVSFRNSAPEYDY